MNNSLYWHPVFFWRPRFVERPTRPLVLWASLLLPTIHLAARIVNPVQCVCPHTLIHNILDLSSVPRSSFTLAPYPVWAPDVNTTSRRQFTRVTD
jgi:hypothetical protein